jgi:hypothetical protein
MIKAVVGISAPLQLQLKTAAAGLWPRALIKDSVGGLVDTIDLNDVGGGLYLGAYAFLASGSYNAVFKVYTDNLYTEEAPYETVSDGYAVSDAGDAGAQYVNRMSTTLQGGSIQELLAWAEKDGARITGSSNCTVTIKDGSGGVLWADTLASPNADGVYLFSNAATVVPGTNYYVVIEIEMDSLVRTSHQSFFVVG